MECTQEAFAPLACQSFYSLLWGTASPAALCRRAREAGVPGLALTDRAGLYGALPFWEAARREEIQPVLGALLPGPPAPARLLAADAAGYRRLARILTRFHLQRGDRAPAFSLLDALREDRKGLEVLTASPSLLDALARDTGPEGLWAALYPLGPQQDLIRYSRRSGIPLAATAPVYFLDPDDHRLHRMLRAIGLSTKLDRVPPREMAPAWAWFHPGDRWRQRYLHCPEALTGMQRVLERCALPAPPWGDWVFPPFDDLTPDAAFSRLSAMARRGAQRRYKALTAPVRERLEHELAIIREKESGTMEQLIVTPLRPLELILGKTIPFILISMAQMLAVTVFAKFWFRIPMAGSVLQLTAATLLFLLSTLGIGLFISTVSQTQQQAMMTTFFFILPFFMLSGFVFPIANMPVPVQWLSLLNPLRHMLVIIRGIFLKGTGLAVLWPQYLALALLGVLVSAASVIRFRKRLD